MILKDAIKAMATVNISATIPSAGIAEADIKHSTAASVSQVVQTAKAVQYVYTIRQTDFIGDTIYSLNQLKEMDGFAHIHQKQIQKYVGREDLMKMVIPSLNCLWNDVIFFTPLHPNRIYRELVEIGYKLPEFHFFKIPADLLKGKRVTLFQPPLNPLIRPSLDQLKKEDFTAFDADSYKELAELPPRGTEYFKAVFDPKAPDKRPLVFTHILHVMCQDALQISDIRVTVIKWSDP